MKFSLTILGSTSAIPTISKHHTAQLLTLNEQLYLIDCGEGTQTQLRKAGINFQRIDHIFISHLHGDHYLGLIGLLFTMHLLGRNTPITIYAPKELELIIRMHANLYGAQLRFEINIVNLEGKEVKVILEDKHIKVTAFPLKHTIPCYGYLFEEQLQGPNISKSMVKEYNIPIEEIKKIKKGDSFETEDGLILTHKDLLEKPYHARSYAFCSDTSYYQSIVNVIKGVDLLYHEATFMADMKKRAKETGHATTLDAAKIANEAGVYALLIGHLSARYTDYEPILAETKTEFTNTFHANEGIVYELVKGYYPELKLSKLF